MTFHLIHFPFGHDFVTMTKISIYCLSGLAMQFTVASLKTHFNYNLIKKTSNKYKNEEEVDIVANVVKETSLSKLGMRIYRELLSLRWLNQHNNET